MNVKRDPTQFRSIYLGFDPREADAFAVARRSIERRLTYPIPIRGVVLDTLREAGLYSRPTERRDGKLWDAISEAPMSTEFACSRFLVPTLAREGWALFADCDILARANLCHLFDQADPRYAVMCVKHDYRPTETTKMDGQTQMQYLRKNWSSVMMFHVTHPANRSLTVEMVNSLPGRELHRFCWLNDAEIGELDPAWNFLVGHSDPSIDAKIVHFTEGGPWMAGYEDCEFADEWRAELMRWAA
jgi:hypothetical protein